ncbi:MAG TPA: class I SAM-dependent methyltransferase [Clostridia bacterium]|nr:class I SAM-dependent methyltransferase [Clostridia bacterium]
MDKYTEQNKSAWEYNAYDFWVSQSGTPSERAKNDIENPRAMLKKYSKYFDEIKGLKIANICGSCGKKAIPLSLLGAEVTVFDISEDNKRYACETAAAANTHINYVVEDVMNIDMSTYGGYFDIVFMEGGVLHYFFDISGFMVVIKNLLKDGGKMICSDFHPIHKALDVLKLGNQPTDYFSTDIVECEMAHAKFYNDDDRKKFPKCFIRRYTLSEIINTVINTGYSIKSFEEHPAWTDPKLPGEFTLLAEKV